MTIYTIVFNGYGEFLKDWVYFVKNQTRKADEIIVVLGKDPGIDVSEVPEGVKVISSESNNMGFLRNLAVKEITTERMLYFSVDDILLPNAVEEIFKCKTDVVALKFYHNGKILDSVVIKSEEDIKEWKTRFYIEGWKSVNKKIFYKEDVEVPNFPFSFDCFRMGLTASLTVVPVAIYKRWEGSHGMKSAKKNSYLRYQKEIDKHM